MAFARPSRRRVAAILNFLCTANATGSKLRECTANANGLAKTLFLLLSPARNRFWPFRPFCLMGDASDLPKNRVVARVP
jgi:hypothetical protein